MMKEMMSEVLLIATISRKRLVLQLVIVDELGFIDVESIIRMGVYLSARRALSREWWKTTDSL